MKATVSMAEEYAKFSLSQKTTVTLAVQYLMKNKDIFPKLVMGKEAFSILDLGCADGVNSIPVLTLLIDEARKLQKDKQIIVYLNDTTETALKKAVDNLKTKLSTTVSLDFVGVARSFYTQLMDVDMPVLDFAYSMTALHFLSRVPGPYQNFGYIFNEEFTKEGKLWEDQADADLKTFLEFRAKEIKKGGHLVISTLGSHDILTQENKNFSRFGKGIAKSVEAALETTGLEKYKPSMLYMPMYVGQESSLRKRYESSPHFKLITLEMHDIPFPPGVMLRDKSDGGMNACKGFVKIFSYGFLNSTLECEGVPKDKIQEFFSNLYDVQIPIYMNELVESKEGFFTSLTIYLVHLERI